MTKDSICLRRFIIWAEICYAWWIMAQNVAIHCSLCSIALRVRVCCTLVQPSHALQQNGTSLRSNGEFTQIAPPNKQPTTNGWKWIRIENHWWTKINNIARETWRNEILITHWSVQFELCHGLWALSIKIIILSLTYEYRLYTASRQYNDWRWAFWVSTLSDQPSQEKRFRLHTKINIIS